MFTLDVHFVNRVYSMLFVFVGGIREIVLKIINFLHFYNQQQRFCVLK